MLALRLALRALRLSLPLSLLLVSLALALGQRSGAPVLAFLVNNMESESHVYLLDIFTGANGPITAGWPFRSVSWWYDGESLLIQDMYLALFRLSADGRYRQTLNLPTNVRGVRPGLRDQTFAYLAPLASGVDEVWLQVGGEPRNLSQTPTAWESRPAFSPDGRWLAWLSYEQGVGFRLLAYDLEVQTHHEILDSLNYVDGPSWASDGRLLALESNLTTWAEALIWDGPLGELTRVRVPTHLTPGEVTWSPQADRIAYVRVINGAPSLWLYDLRIAEDRRLTPEGELEYQPAWSADGRWLAFSRQATQGSKRLVVWDMQSMSHRLLPVMGARSGPLQWRP